MTGPGKIPLRLLAGLYGAAVRGRNRLYDARILPSYKSVLPVISIGNITAGGNAKTPLCISLAGALAEKGMRPVILSRGYGGSARGPRRVLREDDAEVCGDEPLMMARAGLTVVTSRRRAEGARFIEAQGFGDAIILDDGFQHRALARDLDILSVNLSGEATLQAFLRAELLPLGRFREPRDRALARAQVVVFAERQWRKEAATLDARLLKLVPPAVRVCRSFLEPAGIASLRPGKPFAGSEAVCFCGIANPEGFCATLAELGIRSAACRCFPDHHRFTVWDLEALRAAHPGLPLICTAKDAVKIKSEWAEGVYVLQVRARVEPKDAFLAEVLRRLRGRSA